MDEDGVNVADLFLNCNGEGMTLFPELNEEACIPQRVEHGPNSISERLMTEHHMELQRVQPFAIAGS
ncbi:unnamed protein product [Calypogeia fissa]